MDRSLVSILPFGLCTLFMAGKASSGTTFHRISADATKFDNSILETVTDVGSFIECGAVCVQHPSGECTGFEFSPAARDCAVAKLPKILPQGNRLIHADASRPDYNLTLIIRQDSTQGDYFSPNEFAKNKHDPSARLYSRLDEMADFRLPTGEFHFLLCYYEMPSPLPTTGETSACWEFTQTSDPMDGSITVPTGFNLIDAPVPNNNGGNPLHGLMSEQRGSSFLNGVIGANWCWAIGNYGPWNGGMPAASGGGWFAGGAKIGELYAFT